jgi:hypothetical protein
VIGIVRSFFCWFVRLFILTVSFSFFSPFSFSSVLVLLCGLCMSVDLLESEWE